MRIPIIRLTIVAAFVMLTMESAAAAGDEALSPALEKRMAAIEKKIEATQQTFDQILKGIDDVLWFERVGDVASIDKVYIASPPNPKGKAFQYKIYKDAAGGHSFNRMDTSLARESRKEIYTFLGKYLR